MNKNLKIFIQWLRNYPYDYIDNSTANKCIRVLHSNASQEDKEYALDMLSYFENWTVNQLKRLFDSYPKLNAYNQECLVDVQMYMYQEDTSSRVATQTQKNLWKLLSNSKYNDVAEWAADEMIDYVHPYNFNRAIANYNNNTNRWQRYFARWFMDMWDLNYNTAKKWGRPKKGQWVENNASYLPSPEWCLGDRPIYVYIFSVSDYPDKWGDISLPGCEKDSYTYQDIFKGIAKDVEVYHNTSATNKNYFRCIASMAAKENDAIHIFCNSHHGSWDESGHHCQLLHDFDYDNVNKIFTNTPTASRIHYEVDQAARKSPNILPIFIADYCGSGGVALEKAMAFIQSDIKTKSFHPEGWVPPTIPKSHFEGIRRASREIWLNACRAEQSCYDTPEGGVFTNAFAASFGKNKNLSKIMRQTGRKIIKNGTPSVPTMVCSPGSQKFSLRRATS